MKENYFQLTFRKSAVLLFLIASCFLSQSFFAQQHINWTGAVNTSWSEAGNWNYSGNSSVAKVISNATTPVFKITLTDENNDIAVGDLVTGFGIAHGSIITEIAADKKTITLNLATTAGSDKDPAKDPISTQILFTFATPKPASGPPSIVDIAVINNGATVTMPSGFINLTGLIVGNRTGAVTGSTLIIPAATELTVESSINEPVLLRGGNIINNGSLNINSSLSAGINLPSGAYGMVCGLPFQVPTTPTTFTYSGAGSLKIDTTAGNNNSGGFNFNGLHPTEGFNTTYRILFDGPTTILLSDKQNTSGGAATFCFRVAGAGTAFRGCNVSIGGKGFDLGDPVSGGVNGLINSSGSVTVTIEQGTTINTYFNSNAGMAAIALYIWGNSVTPAKVINKGTLNFRGQSKRGILSLFAEAQTAITEFENQGIFDVDVDFTTAGGSTIAYGSFDATADTTNINVINSGTMNVKQKLNGLNSGTPIFNSSNKKDNSPFFTITNSGTMNFDTAAFIDASRKNKKNLLIQTESRLNNSGTINTNAELRGFLTTNTSTGKIIFKTNNNHPMKMTTFTVPQPAAATAGTTYTDKNGNVYTVIVTKVSGTGTGLITHVNSLAVNPPLNTDTVPSVLTKTGSGTGDATIIINEFTSNNDNAVFSPIQNSGLLSTNPGTRLLTGINGFRSPDSTSVLSIGGDNDKGIASIDDRGDDLINLRGMLKINVSGATTPGVDYDQLKLNGALDFLDISEATLDVTGIYTPTELTTIDIITTNNKLAKEGGITNGGPFANVVGLTGGWAVNYTGVIGGKVQLVFDPANLSTNNFESFKFSLSPNPTTGLVSIAAAKTIQNVTFYNVFGQKVKAVKVNANQKQFDISELQNGIYIMEAAIDGVKKSFKIIKQ